ncbi:Mu-like prophage major head subunit gpT family protein [Nitrospina gracilis]|uniref:Mu-like prophage major head subunit gpT family protein n=1 Tax=Nitrospina gracilis TaxID=35801 RepID=UPI001F3F0FD4|nr:Mu-like prophage major head subunit gpT family protein [Nitrospina gracilis]MCF8719217.1 phage major head subunit gpT-like protein [Nitrospina gracilis Nb-211]
MLVNKSTLTAVFINLKTTFNKAFDAAPVIWDKIAMKVTSTGKSNEYNWLERFPKMREWIGDKHIKNMIAHANSVINKDYEATVGVDRNDIEDDQLGIYGPMAQEAGFSAKQWPDEIVIPLLNDGFTSLCWDGQNFFDTDHPLGDDAGTLYSNKGTAALKFDTLANAQASFGAGRTAIRKMKDYEGRALNLNPDKLMVPPALEDTANALMKNDRLEDGKPNPYKNSAEVVVDGRLTSDTAWFLLVTNRPVKPFIFQERKAPVFVQQTTMESDDVFNKREYKYGVESRGAAAYALPQLAYGSTGAA